VSSWNEDTRHANACAQYGPGQFFVIASRVGGWPAICGSRFDYSADRAGDVMHVTDRLTASDVARGRDTPQADCVNGLCCDSPETRSHTFYDVKTGKLLATLQAGSNAGHHCTACG